MHKGIIKWIQLKMRKNRVALVLKHGLCSVFLTTQWNYFTSTCFYRYTETNLETRGKVYRAKLGQSIIICIMKEKVNLL